MFPDISKIAAALYGTANPGEVAQSIDITETSLTGNQVYSLMEAGKI
jgi:hypothetical protein